MLHNVFGKTLSDSLRSYHWWLLGLVSYIVLIVSVYPMVREEGEAFQELLASYPPALLAAFGLDQGLSIASAEGFLSTYIFGWMVPLLFLIYAISFGARAIAGEEEAGTAELLLANPISRERFVLEKFATLALLLLGLAVTIFLGVIVGGLIVDWEISLVHVAAACLSGAFLGLSFGGLAFAIGGATGRRPLTSGLAAAVAVAAYLVFTLGGLVDWLGDGVKLSPIWLYAGTETLREGLDWMKAGVLVLGSGVWLAVATTLFRRRDVRL